MKVLSLLRRCALASARFLSLPGEHASRLSRLGRLAAECVESLRNRPCCRHLNQSIDLLHGAMPLESAITSSVLAPSNDARSPY